MRDSAELFAIDFLAVISRVKHEVLIISVLQLSRGAFFNLHFLFLTFSCLFIEHETIKLKNVIKHAFCDAI